MFLLLLFIPLPSVDSGVEEAPWGRVRSVSDLNSASSSESDQRESQ